MSTKENYATCYRIDAIATVHNSGGEQFRVTQERITVIAVKAMKVYIVG